jgi:hypothetical protein
MPTQTTDLFLLEGRLQKPSDLTRDDILDNITLYWLTNTGVSSARLSWENKGGFFTAKGVTIPVGVSTFADELYRVPRSWAEQAYPNLVYYNQHDRGGHFAAWEQPQLFSEDVPRPSGRFARWTVFAHVHMPSLGGATEWLDSAPLGPAELRDHVVVVDFWILTCINWLRTEPYIAPGRRPTETTGWSSRRPHARVLVRAPDRPHPAGDQGARIDYPSRSTTTTQFGAPSTPLLAGAVLRRHRRHQRRPPRRRSTLRAIRARHPAAARSSASSSASKGSAY